MVLTGDATSGYSGAVVIPIDLTAEASMGGMMALPRGGPGGPPPATG